MRALAALAASVAFACTSTITTPSPTPPATITAVPSSAVATATPTGTAVAGPRSMRVTAAGAIPTRFRYAAIHWDVVRIWLVDLDARERPRLVVRLEDMGDAEHSVSHDGRVLVLAAPGSRSARAIHVIRPEPGTATIVYDGPADEADGVPLVTRDGTRYAFAKRAGGIQLGIFVGSTAGGPAALLAPVTGRAEHRVIEWSPDGRRLAFARGMTIWIASTDGAEQRVGDGVHASWLSNDALLVARPEQAPAGIDRYDVTTGTLHEVVRAAAPVVRVLADPTGDRLAYEESRGQGAFIGSGPVWIVDASGAARRVATETGLHTLEWSSDGSALTGIAGGDDSSTGVADLLGGPIAHLCVRSDGLPPPPPAGCV